MPVQRSIAEDELRVVPWFVAVVVLAGATDAGATKHEPGLDDVLARVAAYVADYERALGNVVAEEIYEQSDEGLAVQRGRKGAPARTRLKLRSEFVLVRVAGGEWLGFRDVLEVDGEPVQGREVRLAELFSRGLPSGPQLRALVAESARYNIGTIDRNFNLPTLPLRVARSENRARFAFELGKREGTGSGASWQLRFRERVSPSLITTPAGVDVPLSGSLWVEPQSGRLLRAVLEPDTQPRGVRARIEISFELQPDLDLWVPAEMKERYETRSRSKRIRCTATYTNYRRFAVDVELR